MEVDIQATGDRIRSVRNKLGLKQGDFAKLIDATIPAVSNWENGRNLPNNARLKKIAKLGNITVDYLLYGHFYDFVFGSNYKRIPEKYHKVAGFTTVSIMSEAIEYISDNNISLSDKEKINEIITSMMEKTLMDVNQESEYQISYIIKNLNTDEMFDKFDQFLSKDFPMFFEEYNSSRDFVLKLQKMNSFDDIIVNYNKIEDVFVSLQYVIEDIFYIEEMSTLEIRLSDFLNKNFILSKESSAAYHVSVKFSSTSPKISNLNKISTLSIYDDLLSQHIYIIPNYENSYQEPFQYQHTHFIIHNKMIFTALLRSDNTIEINNKILHINELDYVVPLLGVIY